MSGSEARCEPDVAAPVTPAARFVTAPAASASAPTVVPVGMPDRLEETTAPSSSPSPRVVLVDAFNVLHAVLLGKDRQTGWWKKALRERLLERVTRWDGGPDEIWVAFDGSRPAMSVYAEPVAMADESRPQGPTVHCLFVESADDWIVRRARRTERPDSVIVVSADRKVAGRARSAGCEVWTPWAFMARCPDEAATATGAGAGEEPAATEPAGIDPEAPSEV